MSITAAASCKTKESTSRSPFITLIPSVSSSNPPEGGRVQYAVDLQSVDGVRISVVLCEKLLVYFAEPFYRVRRVCVFIVRISL